MWDAEEACRDMVPGGHLTAIQSDQENDFVHKTCGGSHPCWIGLQEDSAAANGWTWSSGESVRFTKWSPGKPDGNIDSSEENAVFIGFDYRYWKNGEASQEWWIQFEEIQPSRRERLDNAIGVGLLILVISLLHIIWSSINFCSWMMISVEKKSCGMICNMLLELLHCVYSAMCFFLCLVWIAAMCPGSMGCTDTQLSVGITGPPLLLIGLVAGAYTLYAALKVRSSIKYSGRHLRPTSAQVYGTQRPSGNQDDRNQGGAVMGLPVYQSPTSKGNDVAAGLAYDPATVVAPMNMNMNHHPYQDPYPLRNEYVPPLAAYNNNIPTGELLTMPQSPDPARNTMYNDGPQNYPASTAPEDRPGVYPSLY